MGGKPPINGVPSVSSGRGRPGVTRGLGRGPRVPVNPVAVHDAVVTTPAAKKPGMWTRLLGGFFSPNSGGAHVRTEARASLTGPIAARTLTAGAEAMFQHSGPTTVLPPDGAEEMITTRLPPVAGVTRPEVGVKLPHAPGEPVVLDLSQATSAVQIAIQRSASTVPTFQPRTLLGVVGLPDNRLMREKPHLQIQWNPSTRELTLTDQGARHGTYLRSYESAGALEYRVAEASAVDGKVTYRLSATTEYVSLAFDTARETVYAHLYFGARNTTVAEPTAQSARPVAATAAASVRAAVSVPLDEQIRQAINNGKGPFTVAVGRTTAGAATVTLTQQAKTRGQIKVEFPAGVNDAEIVETMQAVATRVPLFEAVDASSRVQTPTVNLTLRYVSTDDPVLETPRYALARGHLGVDGIVDLRGTDNVTRTAVDTRNAVFGAFQPTDFAGSAVPPAFIYMTWHATAQRRANLIGNAWGKVRARIPTASAVGADTGGQPRRR